MIESGVGAALDIVGRWYRLVMQMRVGQVCVLLLMGGTSWDVGIEGRLWWGSQRCLCRPYDKANVGCRDVGI